MAVLVPTTKALTRALTRRRLLVAGAASAGLTALGGIAKPHLSLAADRPRITHGIQSGDVTTDSGVVWARTDRPARMLVEVATTDSFKDIRAGTYVDALPESDFTAKALIEDLPAGADIFYRIRFQDLASPTVLGAPTVGRFRTAPDDRRSLSFVWSGDTAGQGWGIDETLADYRGNYKYNLLDANMRAFNAQVPIFAQWDDHEVRDDWGPGEVTTHPRSDLLLLAARGCRAFHEFMPMRETPAEPGRIYRKIPYGPLLDVFMLDMRSYRGPNGNAAPGPYGPASHLLGPKQLAWLKRELKASRATWKVIAADLPLGLQSYEGVGMGDGPPRGREMEIADLLAFIKRSGIHNTLWITADVHYTAAHYYDPSRAQFQDFEPFWEFVSGPIHAGTWWPSELDDTFGPRVAFQKASSRERGENLPPSFGLQFFGHVAIDGASEVMTVTLKDVGDAALWSVDLEPKRDTRSGPS